MPSKRCEVSKLFKDLTKCAYSFCTYLINRPLPWAFGMGMRAKKFLGGKNDRGRNFWTLKCGAMPFSQKTDDGTEIFSGIDNLCKITLTG